MSCVFSFCITNYQNLALRNNKPVISHIFWGSGMEELLTSGCSFFMRLFPGCDWAYGIGSPTAPRDSALSLFTLPAGGFSSSLAVSGRHWFLITQTSPETRGDRHQFEYIVSVASWCVTCSCVKDWRERAQSLETRTVSRSERITQRCEYQQWGTHESHCGG